MEEPKSRASPRRRRARRLLAIGLIVVCAAVAAYLVRSRRIALVPSWAEIKRSVSGRRWEEADAKLLQWISANPEHTEARLMLADNRLGL
jgi:hypothetical protein